MSAWTNQSFIKLGLTQVRKNQIEKKELCTGRTKRIFLKWQQLKMCSVEKIKKIGLLVTKRFYKVMN